VDDADDMKDDDDDAADSADPAQDFFSRLFRRYHRQQQRARQQAASAVAAGSDTADAADDDNDQEPGVPRRGPVVPLDASGLPVPLYERSVREMQQFLNLCDIDYSDCLEKRELVARVRETLAKTQPLLASSQALRALDAANAAAGADRDARREALETLEVDWRQVFAEALADSRRNCITYDELMELGWSVTFVSRW
jgi:hypothetical protein